MRKVHAVEKWLLAIKVLYFTAVQARNHPEFQVEDPDENTPSAGRTLMYVAKT